MLRMKPRSSSSSRTKEPRGMMETKGASARCSSLSLVSLPRGFREVTRVLLMSRAVR